MSILPERYEELREIARGGMGRIVLAHDRYLDRQVAVKVLLGKKGVSALAQTRFVEEAQITGQLAHPNIVPVHELGGSGSCMYLVMRLVQGQTLKQIVKKLIAGDPATQRAYPLRRLLRLFLGVCEAIGYAHGRDVIHRDIKPANIMVGTDDQVLVMDWGISRTLGGAETVADQTAVRSVVRGQDPEASFANLTGEGDLTEEGAVVGTPAYMPLEQAEGLTQLDARADVYALGATLYYLTTHVSPYTGRGHEVMSQLYRTAPPSPSARAPEKEIPAPLEAIILKAMERSRDDRYPDAQALAKDVARYLDGEAVTVYQERSGEALRRVFSRNKAAATAAVAGFVLLNAVALGGGVLNLWESRSVREQAAAAYEAAERAEAARQDARAAAAATAPVSSGLTIAGEAERLVHAFVRDSERRIIVQQALRDEERLQDERRAAQLDPENEVARPKARIDAPEVTLQVEHLRARQAITRCADRLRVVTRDLERLGGDVKALAPFEEQVRAASQRLERAMGEALLARSPSKALAFLDADGARVGHAASLLRARGHLRLGQLDRARRALDAFPAGADETLAAGAAALRCLLEARPLEAQLEAFNAAIALAPSESWLYLRRAETRVELGDFEAAAADYDQAAQLHHIDAWIYSSRMNRLTALWCYDNLTRYTREFVEELAPDNLEGRMVEARNALWSNQRVDREFRGKQRRAPWAYFKDTIEEIAEQNATLANRWGAQGALIVQRADAAEGYAKALLASHPGDRVGLGCQAHALLIRGETREAARLARAGLEAFPQDGRLNTVLGRTLMLGGEYSSAVAHLERGARSDQGSEPWLNLAECLLESSEPADWERGIQAARTGMSRDLVALHYYGGDARPVPADPRLHRVVGKLRAKQGKFASAALQFARALTFSGEGSKASRALGVDLQDALHCGQMHERLGLLNEAIQFYAVARADPKLAPIAERHLQRLTRPR